MNHKYIEDSELIVRYLRGSLTEEESEQFEEHFVDCTECIDQIEATRNFIEGLRFELSEKKERRGFAALTDWISLPAIVPRWLALAAGAVLLAALSITSLVIIRNRAWQTSAEQAKRDSAEWHGRFEEADRQRQETERELSDRLSQLQAELDKRQALEPTTPIVEQPQINMAIFVLKSLRGGEPRSDSITELALPRSPANFVLSLQLEGESGYKNYRATLRDARGRELWRAPGLTRDRYNSLRVLFNSSFFHAGLYSLMAEGIGRGGGVQVIGEYQFRVVKQP